MSDLQNKIVLVTGATGLIGSNLVKHLMALGDVSVIASGRSKEKLEKAFRSYLDDKRFSIVAFDVSDKVEVIDMPIDYVFHAAGPMEGKVIQQTPMSVINPNIKGIINCLDLLIAQEKKWGKKGRLIVFSSVTVYANNTTADLVVTEEDTNITERLESIGAPYSQSKRMAEVIASAYVRQYNCDAVIARFSTVYGDTIYHPDTAFFQFVDKAISDEKIMMNISGIGRRDNIYVDDAIKGLVTIAVKGKTGEAYNISSNGDLGNFAAIDEIAQLILDEADDRKPPEGKRHNKVEYKDGGKNSRKPGLRLDNSKLKSLGWSVKTSLRDGIKTTIERILLRKGELD